uniref:Uncharacterized protein n=1 Tax=Arundo donax TaxID=35708 RepID=A0A0A8XSK4_ARUDO
MHTTGCMYKSTDGHSCTLLVLLQWKESSAPFKMPPCPSFAAPLLEGENLTFAILTESHHPVRLYALNSTSTVLGGGRCSSLRAWEWNYSLVRILYW